VFLGVSFYRFFYQRNVSFQTVIKGVVDCSQPILDIFVDTLLYLAMFNQLADVALKFTFAHLRRPFNPCPQSYSFILNPGATCRSIAKVGGLLRVGWIHLAMGADRYKQFSLIKSRHQSFITLPSQLMDGLADANVHLAQHRVLWHTSFLVDSDHRSIAY
jgi:hypothetical protein